VAASFPRLFTRSDIRAAVATIRGCYNGRHAAELAQNCPEACAIAEQVTSSELETVNA